MTEVIATTKENVLLIAPELYEKIENVAQVCEVTIDPDEVQDDTEYTVYIGGESFAVDSGSEASVNSIIAALNAEIDSELVYVVSKSDKLVISAVQAGVSFAFSVSDNLIGELITSNYNGDLIWDLLLDDVIIQVSPRNFKDEVERAQRYLMAHLLTLTGIDENGDDIGSLGDLIEERVGEVVLKYKAAGFNSDSGEYFYSLTRYGVVFYEIYKRNWFLFI